MLGAFTMPVEAKIIVECGSQKGAVYHSKSMAVKEPFWAEDSINGSTLIVIEEDLHDVDVQFKDARGKFISLKDDDFTIKFFPSPRKDILSIMALAEHGGTVIHYVLDMEQKELLRYQSRLGDFPIRSTQLMKAKCNL